MGFRVLGFIINYNDAVLDGCELINHKHQKQTREKDEAERGGKDKAKENGEDDLQEDEGERESEAKAIVSHAHFYSAYH